MKPILSLCAVLLTTALCHAQLNLTPQFGFERSKTNINYNQLKKFSPEGAKTFFKAALRADYRTKKGHGAFAGIGTSPSAVQFSFTNPSNALSNFSTSVSGLQLRLEAGYQFTSKKINFKPASKQSISSTNTRSKYSGSYGCRGKKSSAKEAPTMNMRLQPFLGMAYLPSIKNDVAANGNLYQYNAGNWKTAMVTGISFLFAHGNKQIASLSLSYTKGLGNLDTRTITSSEAGKTISNSFSSRTSNWGLTFGVPISLAKNKKPEVKKYEPRQHHYRSKFSYHKSRCVRTS